MKEKKNLWNVQLKYVKKIGQEKNNACSLDHFLSLILIFDFWREERKLFLLILFDIFIIYNFYYIVTYYINYNNYKNLAIVYVVNVHLYTCCL